MKIHVHWPHVQNDRQADLQEEYERLQSQQTDKLNQILGQLEEDLTGLCCQAV